MDDVVDMIAKGASASEVSDRLKDILMQKSAANIDEVRPQVAASMFGATGAEVETDAEEESKQNHLQKLKLKKNQLQKRKPINVIYPPRRKQRLRTQLNQELLLFHILVVLLVGQQ